MCLGLAGSARKPQLHHHSLLTLLMDHAKSQRLGSTLASHLRQKQQICKSWQQLVCKI